MFPESKFQTFLMYIACALSLFANHFCGLSVMPAFFPIVANPATRPRNVSLAKESGKAVSAAVLPCNPFVPTLLSIKFRYYTMQSPIPWPFWLARSTYSQLSAWCIRHTLCKSDSLLSLRCTFSMEVLVPVNSRSEMISYLCMTLKGSDRDINGK